MLFSRDIACTYSLTQSCILYRRSSTYAFTLCMRESLFEIANIIRDDEVKLSWQERMLSLILSSIVGFSAMCIYGIRDAILRSDKAGLDVLDKNHLITRARKAIVNTSVYSEEPVTYIACNDSLVSLRSGEICECGKCHSGLLDCSEDWFGSPRSSVCESFINYESK